MAQILSLLLLAVMIFAIVDAVTSDNWRIRFMPKVAWVLLIVFLPLIGSILWFVLGKERTAPVDRGSFGDPRRQESLPQSSSTEDDLAAVEREIAFHEKQAEIRRLEAQLRAKREQPDT
jgi:hypothetical protein